MRQSSTRRKLPAIPQAVAKPMFNNCRRCGAGTHPRQSCPARDATCYRCNRRGHFSSQCLSNTVAMISTSAEQPPTNHSNQYEDLKYLDTVENANSNMWELELRSGQDVIRFKVDTGAEVTVLSDKTWKSLN